jgi:Rrf2 family protein
VNISAKTRYALAATIRMAQLPGDKECVTLIRLAEDLKISKIYLEQIFSLLKRGGVVNAVKGARGGYLLTSPPAQINILDIMRSIESSLFSDNEATVPESAPDIEQAIKSRIFDQLDLAVTQALTDLTLADLATEAEKCRGENYMYYL